MVGRSTPTGSRSSVVTVRVTLCAIGKSKNGPEQALYQEYSKRLRWNLTCREFEHRIDNPAVRKQKEGQSLLEACTGHDVVIALDERGSQLSSREFCDNMRQWQSQGHSSFAFLIGGSDGLEERVTQRADLLWSFGRVTWPHMLVRAMLAEQLYRCYTMLNGHPYHRD